MNRLLAIGAICLVCAALVAGLLVVGGPTRARNEKYDQTRLMDLRNIVRALKCDNPAKTPTELSKDEIGLVCSRSHIVDSLTDPETGTLYDFQVINDIDVKICATFHDVDQLRKSWRYKRVLSDLKFDGNVGCITQSVVKPEPA